MKFERELEQFLSEYHSKETTKSYMYGIRHYMAMNPKAIRYTYQDVLNYLEGLTGKYKNPVTRGTQLAAIKKYYDFLLMTGKRGDHPCRSLYIKRPKHQVQVQDLFTPSELELLMEKENRYKTLERRDKVLISIMIYQGVRTEELRKLNIQDIDLDNGTIYIKRTQTTNNRTLELHSKQFLLFERYIHQDRPKLYTGKSNRLMVTHRGETFKHDTIAKFFKPMKSLFPNRKLNPMTIRQSVIANWLNIKKYQLGDVQIMAGHRYPSSTERYLAKDSESQRKIINQFHPLK